MPSKRPQLVYLELADPEAANEYSWTADAVDGEQFKIYYKARVLTVSGDKESSPFIDTELADGPLAIERDDLKSLLAESFDLSILENGESCICGYRYMPERDFLNCPRCDRPQRAPRAVELHLIQEGESTPEVTLGRMPVDLTGTADLLWQGADEEGKAFLILCSGDIVSLARINDERPGTWRIVKAAIQAEWNAGQAWTLDDAAFALFPELDFVEFECPECHAVRQATDASCPVCGFRPGA